MLQSGFVGKISLESGRFGRPSDSDPTKLALAARSRRETTLSVKQIAVRLHLGKPKGARSNLHKFMNGSRIKPSPIQMDWISNEE